MRWGKKGLRCTPIFQRYYGRVQMRNTIFPIWSPYQSHVSSSSVSGTVYPDQRRIMLSSYQYPDSCHPAGTQTEGGLGYHPSLKCLWEANQARTQLEYELIQETQELAERCEHKQARRHARWRALIIDQTDATLQEVLSQVSSTEAIKLLPWCISVVVPFCYISGAASTAVQQDESISIISGPCPTVPKPCGLSVLGPSGDPILYWQLPLYMCLPC